MKPHSLSKQLHEIFSNETPVRLSVVLACHNRREKTLRCLKSLADQTGLKGQITVFLLDDGSHDGTTKAVQSQFPNTRILCGDGSLYWGGGMRIAFSAAMKEAPDFYLWLNDDLVLHDDAISRLLHTYLAVNNLGTALSIIVGAVTNDGMKTAVYGGVNRKPGWNRVRFQTFTELAKNSVECDTFNGNVVLIPAAVAHAVGNIDKTFQHILGDLDYGLRARAFGCKIWIAPGIIANLTASDTGRRIYNPNITWRERWKIQRSPFGLRFNEWWTFCTRHGGALAPVSFLLPYWRFLFPSFVQRAISRARRQSHQATPGA
jgi:GT2 family glycosyltransferase